jgi:hypothetical protein
MIVATPLTVPNFSATFIPSTEKIVAPFAPHPINTVVASLQVTGTTMHYMDLIPSTEISFALFAPTPVNTVIAKFHVTRTTKHNFDPTEPTFAFVVQFARLSHAEGAIVYRRAFRSFSYLGH